MLRGDNIVCGTSTTGTGTLTLAATPAPPGGIDFDAYLKATGIGFVSGNAILVSYTIIEYTDATFVTAKATEKGIGTLTLGASITAATLARTTIQTTATAMSTTGVPVIAGTAVSIGTAANVLVFIGPSSADVPAFDPYVQTAAGDATGACALGSFFGGTLSSGATQTSGVHAYIPFIWAVPMLAKSCTLRTGSAHTLSGGTATVYARIYAKTTGGQPGKLLYDFGSAAIGSVASTNTKIPSGAVGNGFPLTPGEYFLDVISIFTGTSGNLQWAYVATGGLIASGFMGASSGIPAISGFALTDVAATSDPAFLTGWGVRTGNPSNGAWHFLLNVS